jgi:phosphate transport system permease protein
MTIAPEAPASNRGGAMLGSPEGATLERPQHPRRSATGTVWEISGCLVASLALILILFSLAGTHPPFGMFVSFMLAFLTSYGVLTFLLHGSLVAKDRLATVCIWFGASLALFPLIQVLISVAVNGIPVVFAHFPAFLVHDMATAGPRDPVWKGGMGNAIIGTVEQVGLATIYTVPISILTATYLAETSSTFSRIVRATVDCMMGTPSIIAGLFLYLFWVQPRGTNGFSGFAASIALAILMLPVMIRTAEEVIRVMPGSLREAALALGAPRWKVSLRIVLPTVRSGLLTAVILGVALAVGETAPTLFTAHGSEHYNLTPFHGVQANLPLQAFQLIFLSSANYVRDAWGGAFILVSMVLALFVATRLVGSNRSGGLRMPFRRRRRKEVATS